jgi:hypothetical protein
MFMSSGTAIGSYALRQLPQDRLELQRWFPFCFDYSNLGWYWAFGTFAKACFVVYIIRMESCSQQASARIHMGPNRAMGKHTLYFVSIGVGRSQEEFLYTPYTLCRGHFEEKAVGERPADYPSEHWNPQGRAWSLASLPNEEGAQFVVSSDYPGHLSIDATWDDLSRADLPVADRNVRAKCSLLSTSLPALNDHHGDSPRRYGTGTSYWSYPSCAATLEVDVSGGSAAGNVRLTGGHGWIDRQVMRADSPNVRFGALLYNLQNAEVDTRFLPGFVWIVARMEATGIQFLITCNKHDISLESRAVWPAVYALYKDGENPITNKRTSLRVLDAVEAGETLFPTIFQVILEGEEYHIDGSEFGVAISMDPTNNFHWAGGCFLRAGGTGTGPIIGSGLIEANRFGSPELLLEGTLMAVGVPLPSPALPIFLPGSHLPEYWFASTVALLVFLGLLVVYIVAQTIAIFWQIVESKNDEHMRVRPST